MRERGKRRDGADPYDRRSHSRRSDEDDNTALAPRYERAKWPPWLRGGGRLPVLGAGGCDGGPKPGACAAGVGTRAYAQTISRPLSRAVTPAISVPLVPRVAPIPRPFEGHDPSFFYHSVPLALAPAIEGVRLSPSLSLWGRTGEPRRSRPSAHDLRPRRRALLFVQGCSVSR